MIVLTNENAVSGNLKGIESLQSILKSITDPSSSAKKLRHSLKDLCFQSPSPQLLEALFNLFKKDVKTQSEYFILLCHNIIMHAHFSNAIPQTQNFLEFLSQSIASDSKKTLKSLELLYRVFFNICHYTPSCQSLVVNTVSYILTLNLDFLKKKPKRKSFVGSSLKNPHQDLIVECIMLLNDLPYFNSTVTELLSKADVVQGLVNIYNNFTDENKHILAFLSRVCSEKIQIPAEILSQIPSEGSVITANSFAAQYFVSNLEKFKPHIKHLFDQQTMSSNSIDIPIERKHLNDKKDACVVELDVDSRENSTSLIQLQIISDFETPPALIFDTISSDFDKNESSLYPLLKYLEKTTRIEKPDPKITKTLFKYCQGRNVTLAFLSFMCICFISDEIGWINTYFIEIMDKLSYTGKCQMVQMLLKSWVYALDHAEQNKTFVRGLFELLIMKFGDCIDQSTYTTFINKVVSSGCSNDFIEIFTQALHHLPSTESVIYVFFGASLLRGNTEQGYFDNFLQAANAYIQYAGPAMLSFYRMTIDKNQ